MGPEAETGIAPAVSSQYLAGFFDGEGCFGIARSARPRGRIEHSVRVSVTQKRRAVLAAFVERFQGTVGRHKSGVYVWSISGRGRTRVFLDAIQPFLVVKAPAASVVRRFLDTGRQPRQVRVCEAVYAERERLKAELQTENRR